MHFERQTSGNGLTLIDGSLAKGNAIAADVLRTAYVKEYCIRAGQ